MLIRTYSSAVFGINASLVTVEVNIGTGVNFFMVGLPDAAVRESQHRIQAALRNTGYRVPGKQITINLAPADLKKEGSAYDLPIAMGILAASEQVKPGEMDRYMMLGEVMLDGNLQKIKGALPIALLAREQGFKGLILPRENAAEAAIVEGLDVYGVENITQVIDFFDKDQPLEPMRPDLHEMFWAQPESNEFDFADVKGQLNINVLLK